MWKGNPPKRWWGPLRGEGREGATSHSPFGVKRTPSGVARSFMDRCQTHAEAQRLQKENGTRIVSVQSPRTVRLCVRKKAMGSGLGGEPPHESGVVRRGVARSANVRGWGIGHRENPCSPNRASQSIHSPTVRILLVRDRSPSHCERSRPRSEGRASSTEAPDAMNPRQPEAPRRGTVHSSDVLASCSLNIESPCWRFGLLAFRRFQLHPIDCPQFMHL
jgi:hypothetical protein